MSLLITLIVYLLIIAILYWIVTRIPVPAPFTWIRDVIFGIVALLLVLSLFGGKPLIKIGQLYTQDSLNSL